MTKMKKAYSIMLATAMMLNMSVTAFATVAIKEDTYYCNHGDECYSLICGHEETCTTDEHEHGPDCYKESTPEPMTVAECAEAHSHTEACYHQHSEECWTTTECTAEEHSHGDGCFTDSHSHDASCYETRTCSIDTDTCQLTECSEEHEHTAECHTHDDGTCSYHSHDNSCIGEELICGKEEGTNTLNCSKEEHTHNESCTQKELTCGMEEGALICGKEEHTCSEACIMPLDATEDIEPELICTLPEHVHGVDCHIHTDACYAHDPNCTKYIPADLDSATQEESGIDFNLYNFNGNINLDPEAEGKVFALLSKYFNFDGAGETNRTSADKSVVGNLGAGHFTYEKNLGEDGAPIITWGSVGQNPELEKDESRSIGYVFGIGDHFGVTKYEDIKNTPLIYDPKTGFYIYDSSKNAVDFNGTDEVYVRGYKEQGDASAQANGSFDEGDGLADFFPFNSRVVVDAEGNIIGFVEDSEEHKIGDTYIHYDGSPNAKTADDNLERADYWFGATMSSEFYYPKDGILNDEALKYSFSGDDDVVVYIDGILALDLGGAHSRASGEIDFSTGLVETWLDAANQTALNPTDGPYDHRDWAAKAAESGVKPGEDGYAYVDGKQIRYAPTTLYDCYKAAYEEKGMTDEQIEAKLAEMFVPVMKDGTQETVKDAYGNEHLVYRFRDYSSHDFNWFYLERHSWEANFKTEFNLPTVPNNSLTIEKVVEDEDKLLEGKDIVYVFEVWETDEDGNPIKKIGEDVQLKAGGKTTINNMIDKTKGEDDHYGYIVKEVAQIVDGVRRELDEYETSWNSQSGLITGELSAHNSQVVTFTNVVKPVENPPYYPPYIPEEEEDEEDEDENEEYTEKDIPDEEVPLVDILDEEIPLASVPQTGKASSLWMAFNALSAAVLLLNCLKDEE